MAIIRRDWETFWRVLFVGLLAIAWGFAIKYQAETFSRSGIQTTAVLTQDAIEDCTPCIWTAPVSYTTVSGKRYFKSSVPTPRYARAGQTIQLWYLSDDPSRVEISDPSGNGPVGWFIVAFGSVVVVLSPFPALFPNTGLGLLLRKVLRFKS